MKKFHLLASEDEDLQILPEIGREEWRSLRFWANDTDNDAFVWSAPDENKPPVFKMIALYIH